MATSSGLFLATIYNQSQLAKRKHVARYWSINTAAKAVPLCVHPSPLVITTKLAAAMLGGPLFGGGVLPAQYCPCGSVPCHWPIRAHLCTSPGSIYWKCTRELHHCRLLIFMSGSRAAYGDVIVVW